MCLPITIWQIDVELVPLYRLGRASGNAIGLATGGLRHRSKKRLSQNSGAKLPAAIHLLELYRYKMYTHFYQGHLGCFRKCVTVLVSSFAFWHWCLKYIAWTQER